MDNLNLQYSLDAFVRGLSEDEVKEIKGDQRVVAAIQNSAPDAEDELARWLHLYKVFMGYSAATRRLVCAEILKFAGRENRPQRLTGADDVFEEFKMLENRIECVLSAAGMQPRAVTSLCSKALWCCYPADVPIYDTNARVAVTVVARLIGIPLQPHEHAYYRFLSVWFTVYGLLHPLFNQEEMREHFGYSVRAFDRFLWYLADATPPPLQPHAID